jgi:hypothetical protein
MLSFLLPVPSSFSSEGILEKLPPILEEAPSSPYQILSPVGAGEKTIDAARLQTQREARKVDADAIIHLICEPGGLRREGLTWQKHDAYCRGTAIQLQSPRPTKNSSRKIE